MKCELYNDNFQNWKAYPIQKAQLVTADLPYQLGTNAYASNPSWYEGGTSRTVKVNLQDKPFSKPNKLSTSPNICIFVIICL